MSAGRQHCPWPTLEVIPTIGNNFQDSNKSKSTENETMGYLPRVFFFNTFELGAVI
jgi:hypothetical protein